MRLKKETATQPDSVEVNFCKKFEELKRHPMNKELNEIYVKLCLMAEPYMDAEAKKKFEAEIEKLVPCRIAKTRLEYLGYSIDSKTTLVLSYLSDGTPGTIVMYVYYLAYWCKKNNKTGVTFDDFGMNIFPWGFPSIQDLDELWDLQKVDNSELKGTDNLLDYYSASESIRATNNQAEDAPLIFELNI